MKTLLFAAVLAVGAGANVLAEDEPLEVAQGATKNVTASESHTTIDVHGTLTVSGGTSSAVVQLKGTGPMTVGAASGDNAAVTVGDYGQIDIGNNILTVGGPGGTGLITLGGKRKGNTTTSYAYDASHFRCGSIVVSAEATSATGFIDILRLNDGGSLIQAQYFEKITNLNATCDARILFNGGSLSVGNAYSSAQRFVSTAGKAIVFESENGKPIDLRYQYGSAGYPANGLLKTAGDGDMVVYSETGSEHHYGWKLNLGHIQWGHKGDFRLAKNMWVVCDSTNALPCLADGGGVVLEGNSIYNSLYVNGYNQDLNGLKAAANSVVTNSSTTVATLRFGSARADGTLNVPRLGGAITVAKVGAGTLTVTNTPSIPSVDAKAGTILFAPGCDVRVKSVTAAAGAKIVVDGVTVSADSVRFDADNIVETRNGGRLVLAMDVAANETACLARDKVASGATVDKTGAGTLCYVAKAQVLPAGLRVREGTLLFAELGSTNEFWRVTIKAPEVAGYYINLSPFRLHDGDFAFCDGGCETGTTKYYTQVANTTAPEDLTARQIMFSSTDYTTTKHGSDNSVEPEVAMFANSSVFSCRFNLKPNVGNPDTWLVATYRIAPLNGKYVYGYDVKSQWDGWNTQYAGTWMVESSPSGKDGTWVVMDEQSAQKARGGESWYRGTATKVGSAYCSSNNPYPLKGSYMASAGFDPAADVQVDPGATLDCSLVTGGQELTSLTIDWSKSGTAGVLKGVKLAVTGTLNLVNVAGKAPTGDLPLAFVDSVTGGDLSGWTVKVNGVVTAKRLLFWSNSKLSLSSVGLTVIVR